MKKWIIINHNDANDSFYVEAKNANDAAFKALGELGWGVGKTPIKEVFYSKDFFKESKDKLHYGIKPEEDNII